MSRVVISMLLLCCVGCANENPFLRAYNEQRPIDHMLAHQMALHSMLIAQDEAKPDEPIESIEARALVIYRRALREAEIATLPVSQRLSDDALRRPTNWVPKELSQHLDTFEW